MLNTRNICFILMAFMCFFEIQAEDSGDFDFSDDLENPLPLLMSYRDDLLKKTSGGYCINQDELHTIINAAFAEVDKIFKSQNNTNTPLATSDAPLIMTTTPPPTTTPTTTTTTTTVKPIPKCGVKMASTCVKRLNCKNSAKRNAKLLVDLKEHSECHYLEACCSADNFLNETIPIFASQEQRCGVTNPNGIYMTVKGNEHGEVHFGELPWIVGIFNSRNVYRAGGALIAPKVVLSSASNLFNEKQLTVRAGEWDMETDNEVLPYQERSATIVLHQNFSMQTYENDIALLFLNTPFQSALHIRHICQPDPVPIYDYTNCLVAGWNQYPSAGRLIATQVPFELMKCDDDAPHGLVCATSIGQAYLTYSTGSALVCTKRSETTNRYYHIGAWSHDHSTNQILFTNVISFKPWIENQIKNMTSN